MGLVLWIAIHLWHLKDLLAYIDDAFSYELEGNVLWYSPYHKSFPAKETWLLELWDELGILHDEPKQLHGSTLTIIGFDVDSNAMMITMPPHSCADLIDAVHSFAKPSHCQSLCDFQRFAGWMNWALNTYPLLHPGMSYLYDKMSGKSQPHQLIWISVLLCQELIWFAN